MGHFPHHDALRYFPVILDVADIDPVERARLGVERQTFFCQQGKQVRADVEDRILGYQVQHGRLENIDAGADMVRQGRFLAGLFLERLDAAILVADHHAIARHLVPRHFARDHAGQRPLAAMLEQGRLDVEVDHRITAQDDGGIVKKAAEFLDLLHAAGRAYRLRHHHAGIGHIAFERVADLHAILMAVAEILFDLFMQVTDIDHDVAHAILGQVLDQIGHHGLAQDGDHGLG